MKKLMPSYEITGKILFIRQTRVMLDQDLARLYGVSTKALNQAVKRNSDRFPSDFMFRLNKAEKDEVVTNCDHLQNLKFSPQLPYAFTDLGVAMLSSVLNSEKAIQMNIEIMRTFVKIRRFLSAHGELADKLRELEIKTGKHDKEIQAIFEAIRKLMIAPEKPKRQIGFHVK